MPTLSLQNHQKQVGKTKEVLEIKFSMPLHTVLYSHKNNTNKSLKSIRQEKKQQHKTKRLNFPVTNLL